MGVRLAKRAPLLLTVGLWSLLTIASWGQSSNPLQTPTDAGDPALVRQKNLKELLNQARAELVFNRNPAAAKEKCLKALALDPDNAEAHLFLAQAEGLLKGQGPGETRSPVSAFPDPAKISEAAVRARPTTTVVRLPSDRAHAPTAAAMDIVRRTVVDTKETYVAPKPRSVWLNQRRWMWVAIAFGAVVVIGTVTTVSLRLFGAKRRRMPSGVSPGQSRSPSPPSFEVPVGASTLGAGATDDFPIGGPAPKAKAATATAGAPTAGKAPEDTAEEFWEKSPKGKGGSVVTAAVESPSASEIGEEVPVLSASQIFGDEELHLGPPKTGAVARPPSPSPRPQPATSAPPQRPAAAKPSTAAAMPERPAPPAKPAPKEEAPSSLLSGISIDSPVIEGLDESKTDADKARGASSKPLFDLSGQMASGAEEEVEMIPFSFDVPVDQTETSSEEDNGPSKVPSLLDVSEPEEMKPIRLEDDYPLGETKAPILAAPIEKTAPLNAGGQQRRDPDEPVQDPYEEILISSGSRKSADPTAPLAGQQIGSESTLIDAQARSKAVFQDQLARGLAAMEKGLWKDAVKCLSVANAMNPADDYVRTKLREAREKRDRDAG